MRKYLLFVLLGCSVLLASCEAITAQNIKHDENGFFQGPNGGGPSMDRRGGNGNVPRGR